MNKFRFRLRVLLLALAIGFFSVTVYEKVVSYLNPIPVELPQIESDSPIIVTTKKCPMGGGGG